MSHGEYTRWSAKKHLTNTEDKELRECCKLGDFERVRVLIEKPINLAADPNSPDALGLTALHIASQNGMVEIVKYLLSKNGNPTILSQDGRKPLHLAASKGCVRTLQALVVGEVKWLHRSLKDEDAVEEAFSIDSRDAKGWSPLRLAAWENQSAAIEWLIREAGANPHARGFDGGWTPVHAAAWRQSSSAIDALIHCGADGNVRDDIGRTPLHVAAKRHCKATFASLCGAREVETRKQQRWWEDRRRRLEGEDVTPEFLFSDVHARDNDGCVPAHVAALEGNHVALRWLVVQGGTDVESADRQGAALLHAACQNGDVQNIEFLVLDAKSNKLARDHQGRTPLHYAAKNEHLGAVKYLINTALVDAQVCDQHGKTPLQAALNSAIEATSVVQFLQTLE